MKDLSTLPATHTLLEKRITVWCLETGCTALLVSVLLVVFSPPYDLNPLGLLRDLAFGFFAALTFFFTSGYLLTTALADAFWRSKGSWLYPLVVFMLFSVHLQLLFLVASGWTSGERLPVRIAGPCFAFACAYVGGCFLRKPVASANTAECN
jgi:hypothetical protein